ncbi:polysaccharide pyruvyl transferase WcaK-like protein [Leifsonia sp. EB41]|uniref:hypothetical protein n=1 Tax=Leifsonia sp. EB41 TaxID=3156260 RepID=UPI003519148B
MNTLKLELEETRDQLAGTLDDIFATFNVRVQIRSHPVIAAAAFLTVLGGAAALVARGMTRGR